MAVKNSENLSVRKSLKSSSSRAAWIAVFLSSVALLLLPVLLRLDGKQHAEWLQFLGRFHPLAVHIPIGLILLIPVLEIAGRSRPALREAAGFVLPIACAACLGSLVLGYALAYGSGETGTTVTQHMWGGIALCVGVMLCLMVRPAWSAEERRGLYPSMLAVVLIALFWTAHLGGAITHGESYLTALMPAPLKRWFSLGGAGKPSARAGSFYAQHVDPIFDANCVSCHGPSKIQGGLRLDSYDVLMKGGKDGPVVVAGNLAKSVLLERITLPMNHPHFMPAEGRPPLRPEQIAWIRAWIEQGASSSAVSLRGVVVANPVADPPPEPVGDYSALMPEIQQMQQGQGAKLVAVSAKPSDGLILNTVDAAATFNDAELARFKKFALYIVEADLARTGVTDASFDSLSQFAHLRTLHLEGTAITGVGLAKLTKLHQLNYLNLSETKVDSAAVAPLRSMAQLHHLYLFDTPANPVPKADDAEPAVKAVLSKEEK